MLRKHPKGTHKIAARAALIYIVSLVALTAIPAASAFALFRSRTQQIPGGLEPKALPIFVPAIKEKLTDSIEGVARLTWATARAVSQGVASPGIVTSVLVRKSDKLKTGAPVYSSNDHVVIALTTTAPLFREIALGDRGRDVSDLKEALVRMGFLDSATEDIFDWSTLKAFRKMLADAGVTEREDTVDPSRILWLPEGEVTVSSVAVTVGSQAPAAGGNVLLLSPLLEAVTVDLQSVARFVDLPYDFRFSDKSVPIGQTSGTSVVIRDEVRLKSWSAELAGTEKEVAGRMVMTAETSGVVVPASSVVVSQSGKICVWKSSNPTDKAPTLTEVTLGQPALTGALIKSGLGVNDLVVANPTELAGLEPCL
jgi:hypothetical protein